MLTELTNWIDHVGDLIPHEDRKVLLSPPRLVARFARYAVHRATGADAEIPADDVHARDRDLVSTLLDLWRVLGRYYYRIRYVGLENLPATGPALLVGNHNGGFVPAEGFFTALALHDRFGPDRALYVLAHDFLFEDPVLRRYMTRLGMMRAGHESAHRAFAADGCVLVYPGSDKDTFRPFRERNRIVLAGRKGFVRLAIREQVPIIPVVTAGAHEQFIVLTRGDRLAQLLHAHAWMRADVLPIVLSVPWGLTSGFVPYLPLPAQTTQSFLPAMTWPELSPKDADDEVATDNCYDEVEAAMQTEMTRISRGRHFLLGPTASAARNPLTIRGVDLAPRR